MVAQFKPVARRTVSEYAALNLPGAEAMSIQRQFHLAVKCQGWDVREMARDLLLGNMTAAWFESLAFDQVDLGEDQHHSANSPIAVALFAHLQRLFYAWEELEDEIKGEMEYDTWDQAITNTELERIGVDIESFFDIDVSVREEWKGAQQYFAEVWGV